MNLSVQEQERHRLRRLIELDRAELGAAMSQLKGVVRQRTDVKHFAAERPFAWLIGGLIVGWWVGSRRH